MPKRSLTVAVCTLLVWACEREPDEVRASEEAGQLAVRSVAIQSRADSVQADLELLGAEIATWRETHLVDASTQELLLSLLAHPFISHATSEQIEPEAEGYRRLEERAAGIQRKQREIAADWAALQAEVSAWGERWPVTFEEVVRGSQFEIGEPGPGTPDPGTPGVALGRKPCSMTLTLEDGRHCHLREETCVYVGRENGVLLWTQTCVYRCHRILNPFDKPPPIGPGIG